MDKQVGEKYPREQRICQCPAANLEAVLFQGSPGLDHRGWTVVAQWLNGYTYIAPGGFELEWPFNARFALLSKRVGRHMLSARYDQFQVLSGKGNPEQDGSQQGHAWTAAYLFQLNPQWRFTLEWLRVVSNSYSRGDILGTTGLATETQLQLAVRCALGSSVQ